MTRTNGTLRTWLDGLYAEYNRPELIAPDPLEAVYWYEQPEDREIAALIAASLAYGRAAQIVANTRAVLEPMGKSPRSFVASCDAAALRECYRHFRHRWTPPSELIQVLLGIQRAIEEHGSLEACYRMHAIATAENPNAGLCGLTSALGGSNSMLADPSKSSACKRWRLFLRWMVRRDAIDPGCWTSIAPESLIVPLDTHMHRIALMLGLTQRRQADFKAALEITEAFRRIRPDDPLRYDFVLTRFGIRPELNMDTLRDSRAESRAESRAAKL